LKPVINLPKIVLSTIYSILLKSLDIGFTVIIIVEDIEEVRKIRCVDNKKIVRVRADKPR